MTRHILGVAVAALVVLPACGDDTGDAESGPTPAQAAAITALVETELADNEQRCIFAGLLDAEIDPELLVDQSLTPEDDAELVGIAASCVEDLTRIPAFVDSFIEGAASEGTQLSEAEAICAIESLDDPDPTALADCLDESDTGDGANDEPAGAPQSYGDDEILDRLWDDCDEGNNQACDELYERSPLESDYLEQARTCADRLPDSIGLRCFEDLG